jgi:hypothetical protein
MSNHLLAQLPSLRTAVSAKCEILHDSQDHVFQKYLARWSNINLKPPGAIVLPRFEDDCLKIVRRSCPRHGLALGLTPWLGPMGHQLGHTMYPHFTDSNVLVLLLC